MALVTIRRKKGRIAGFGAPKVPMQILWCGTNRPRKKHGRRANGWSFPPAVREVLLQICNGKTALHLFGGLADFGTRLDIDPDTRPDVCGDAWLAPQYFGKDAFDVVILDPPYISLNQQEKASLLTNAAWCARDLVIWFHTVWIGTDSSLKLEKAYAIRVGDQCSMRCLQIFRVDRSKRRPPVTYFERGPAMKYNRWLQGQDQLPFGTVAISIGANAETSPNGGPRQKGQKRRATIAQDAPLATRTTRSIPETSRLTDCAAGVKSRALQESIYRPAGKSPATSRRANGAVRPTPNKRPGGKSSLASLITYHPSDVQQGASVRQISAGNALAGVSRDHDGTRERSAECLNGKEPAQVRTESAPVRSAKRGAPGVAGRV